MNNDQNQLEFKMLVLGGDLTVVPADAVKSAIEVTVTLQCSSLFFSVSLISLSLSLSLKTIIIIISSYSWLLVHSASSDLHSRK